jgi:primosomal protein N' (replication factor Y)
VPPGDAVAVSRERPHIRVVRRKPLLTEKLPLPQEIMSTVRKLLGKGEKVLFLINRKGYSAVRCDDCNHMLRCISCDVPLVLYRSRGSLRCPSCAQERPIAETCPHCGGFSLGPFGLGTERLREQVERAFSTDALLVEKEGVKVREVDRGSPDVLHLVVGTAFARRRTPGELFSAAVMLNIDSLLSRPHFRAFERAFQEIVEVAQTIRPEGTLYVESADPANVVLRAAAKYDFTSFYRFELSQRRSSGYPPFSKLIMLTLAVTDGGEKIAGEIRSMLESVKQEGVDILGPIDLPPSPKKQDHRKLQVLLKSKERRQVHDTAQAFLKKTERMKDLSATVDVDPSEI